MAKASEIHEGELVMYMDKDNHRACPKYYPPVGTVGRVLSKDNITVLVQWPAGSTSDNGRWYARLEDVAPVQNDTNNDKR